MINRIISIYPMTSVGGIIRVEVGEKKVMKSGKQIDAKVKTYTLIETWSSGIAGYGSVYFIISDGHEIQWHVVEKVPEIWQADPKECKKNGNPVPPKR